jgi:holo-[acyl-carrier protein] synthase
MSFDKFKILNGIDIVLNFRIKKLHERSPEALKDIFSSNEIDYCFKKKNPYQSLGVRFAAKESFIKAINSHILEYDLSKIEIINTDTGKPEIKILAPEIDKKIKKELNKKNYIINLTLSHEKDYSIAHIIIY